MIDSLPPHPVLGAKNDYLGRRVIRAGIPASIEDLDRETRLLQEFDEHCLRQCAADSAEPVVKRRTIRCRDLLSQYDFGGSQRRTRSKQAHDLIDHPLLLR